MDYLINLAIMVAIYSILGISLDLIVGYTGLLSVTQAAFFGLGAYVTAVSVTKGGITFFVSMFLGIVLTGIISFLIGIILSNLKDDYYALGTLGFNTVVVAIFLNWQKLTNGPMGIPGIARPDFLDIDFTNNFNFLILTLTFVIMIYLISRFIVTSSFGRVLNAIREDETAISVFGYKTLNFKLLIFVISAAMAAIAGSLFASYITFIDPSNFQLTESMFILAIIILGGLGNIQGSMFGALFLILFPEVLRFIGFPSIIDNQIRQIVYGIILILLMLFRPQGFIGKFKI